MRHAINFALLSVAAVLLLACDRQPTDSSVPLTGSLEASARALVKDIPAFPEDPSGFLSGIDNPFLAYETGRIFRYEGETEEGVETIVVEVLAETRTILGVTTTVVHDQAFLDGELVENTFDWFAQDTAGNVWYFGEYSEEIEGGVVVSTEGSWEAGVDGAVPGIVMLAEPRIGMTYRQEFYEGVAEDMAKVLGLCVPVEVPYGTFDCALKTMEWTPLEPGAREFKYYVSGVGLVLEVSPSGGLERIELVAIED